jgi:RNA ligase (TIGR02306 family)
MLETQSKELDIHTNNFIMMERKLATVRKITNIRPIEGADMIELATVGGWNVVVGKDIGHKVGDMVVYCEIDSFLPIRDVFEFLRKSSFKKMGDQEGFRLKTIKLRGQVSQGLILPISVVPITQFASAYTLPEGMDVTEMLGIVKYEPPIPAELSGKVKGLFPSFLRKTDEERVQNLTKEYEQYKSLGRKFYVTEKLDGSSATFYYNDGVFGVCSRNLELLETEGNTFWKVARELDLENKMRDFGVNISLQGELIGEGIQGNPYKIKGQTVKFFNLFDIDLQVYHSLAHLDRALGIMGIKMVPIVDEFFVLPDTIEELLKYAEDKSVLNDKTEREGVVVRSMDRTISFKAISNKFLLNEK